MSFTKREILVSLLAVAGTVAAHSFEDFPYDHKEDGRIFRHYMSPRVPFAYKQSDLICGAPKSWYPYRGDWTGWTQHPMCVDAITDDESSEAPRTFCTFINKNFADGRGIALLTTPPLAKIIHNLEAFAKPESIEGQNDLITGRYGPPPYVSHLFPQKGIGLIANTSLVRGTRLMQETPSLIYNRAIYGLVSEEDRIPMHWHLVYQLPEHTRVELLALHKHHGGDEVDDLMRTNAFGAYYGPDVVSHNNIFPRISRFNHDCRPNAVYYFDTTTMTQYVHAIRPISNGEEISLTYTDIEALYAQRQAATKVSWGFGCQCSICRQPPDHLAASDRRLSMIFNIKEKLNDWSKPLPDRTKLAEYLVDLYNIERLDGGIASAYEAAAYAHSVEGNEFGVRKYAMLAWETLIILYGADHDLTVDMGEMMLDPQGHRTWQFKE